MANKSAAVKKEIDQDEASAGAEVEPKHRYTPSPLARPEVAVPRWLRFPPLSPLRRLRRTAWWPYIAVLGPGVVAAAAGNDAGGIATYASAGASYGYTLLWAMLVVTVSFALVQEMCARMGAVTGKGLSDLIREQFGAGWAMLAILVLFVANTGITVSEFVGIAAAAELFNVPRWIAVTPIA